MVIHTRGLNGILKFGCSYALSVSIYLSRLLYHLLIISFQIVAMPEEPGRNTIITNIAPECKRLNTLQKITMKQCM